jgi:ribosome biogenesis GTPase A
MIPESTLQQWLNWFKSKGENAYCTNAKKGDGVKAIQKAAQTFGLAVNEKRLSRGLQPRPVRAVVIGFPNVGKSALINRLLGKKVVESARKAGVTRQLRWVRISDTIELLDSPGVIPIKLENQVNAVKLAICEDIGEASYDNQLITIALIDLLVNLGFPEILQSRYHLDPIDMTAEDYLFQVGEKNYKGDRERTAVQILNDFRKGLMGPIPLEFPPIPLEEMEI